MPSRYTYISYIMLEKICIRYIIEWIRDAVELQYMA